MKHSLILTESGHQRWTIMQPRSGFDEPIGALGFNGLKDRRYVYMCEVQGPLDHALKVLHDLEAAR